MVSRGMEDHPRQNGHRHPLGTLLQLLRPLDDHEHDLLRQRTEHRRHHRQTSCRNSRRADGQSGPLPCPRQTQGLRPPLPHPPLLRSLIISSSPPCFRRFTLRTHSLTLAVLFERRQCMPDGALPFSLHSPPTPSPPTHPPASDGFPVTASPLLHIPTSSHPQIFTSPLLHISTSSHFHISTFPHLHFITSPHFHINKFPHYAL